MARADKVHAILFEGLFDSTLSKGKFSATLSARVTTPVRRSLGEGGSRSRRLREIFGLAPSLADAQKVAV